MKQDVIKLRDGGKVEVMNSSVKVISSTGTCVQFDSHGNAMDQPQENRVKNFEDFFKMGKEEQQVVQNWLATIKPESDAQKRFINFLKEALKQIDYSYRISTIEPSFDKCGHIYFEKGKEVAINVKLKEWTGKAKEFAPEFDSRLATLYELYLWYAYRIAKGYWSIQYVCDDSSEFGNYWNSPNSLRAILPSGRSLIGGFCDGTGNTYKIVTHEGHYRLCGGDCFDDGSWRSVGKLVRWRRDDQIYHDTGVIILLR